MVPSEKFRKFSLISSSFKLCRNIFVGLGTIVSLAGIILCTLFATHPFTIHTSRTINGRTIVGTSEMSGLALGLLIVGFGVIFILAGTLFVPLVQKMVTKGEKKYPIADARCSKEKLLQDAASLNDMPEIPYSVEVHGDWIDFTFNWRNTLQVFSGIARNQSVYKKLILVKDNGTYKELDYEAVGDIHLGTNGISGGKSVRCGRITHKAIVCEFGSIDMDTKEAGLARMYRLDTCDVSNFAHKWLADHGYRPA